MIQSGMIQVAGVRSLDEGRMLLDCGVDLLGFPLRLPVHAADISEDQARGIIQTLGPWRCVLITYEDDPDRLLELCQFVGAQTVQIHAALPVSTLALLKKNLSIQIVKSYVVGREALSVQDFCEIYSPACDAFITDTFDPVSGACGATGQIHDWAVSAELAQISPRPLVLAGGLNPANVAEAIHQVRPAAVDAHTGLEDAEGFKSKALVQGFVHQARHAFGNLSRVMAPASNSHAPPMVFTPEDLELIAFDPPHLGIPVEPVRCGRCEDENAGFVEIFARVENNRVVAVGFLTSIGGEGIVCASVCCQILLQKNMDQAPDFTADDILKYFPLESRTISLRRIASVCVRASRLAVQKKGYASKRDRT